MLSALNCPENYCIIIYNAYTLYIHTYINRDRNYLILNKSKIYY